MSILNQEIISQIIIVVPVEIQFQTLTRWKFFIGA